MLKEFELDINYSSWEDVTDSLTEGPGLYFVYACYQDKETSKWFSRDLVYIGESEHVKQRTNEHYLAFTGNQEADNLHRGLPSDISRLWYTYAYFQGSESDRKLCEAALIFKHKPTLNTQNVSNWSERHSVSITLRGETRLLQPTFLVKGE